MAVTITDNRTRPSEADATTGWTASSGVAVFTTAPDPVEATGSLGTQVSNSTEDSYFGITSADLTDTLVYCWLLPGGVIDSVVNGGIQIYIGDGSNDRGYHIGGNNGAGFRHDTGPVVWQCFVIDTGALPTDVTNFVGAGAPTLTTITRIGNAFKTLAKSVGGVENCFMDTIAYGNLGLTITGGGSGTEGNFLEIAIEDRSTVSGTAYGICRELGADLFGLQGAVFFGDAAGTGSVDFEDTGGNAVFEDRNIGTNKYGITIQGNATGSTSFILGARDGVGLGSNGFNLVCPSGVGAHFTASDTDVETVGIYGSSISGFNQSVTLSSSVTNAPNHEYFASAFVDCAQIVIGLTEFKNNQIQNSAAAASEGSILLFDDTNVSDLAFTSGGTGHAINITNAANAPFTFTNFTYDGYSTVDSGSNLVAASGSTDAGIYNNTGAAITITISGGDTPTVRNGAGATTTIIANQVTFKLTGIRTDSEVRLLDESDTNFNYNKEIDGIEATVSTLTGILIANGGTGYTVSDTLTISGGTRTVAATLTVTAVNGGVITAVSIASGGVDYTVDPTNPTSVTGGTGNDDATFNTTFTGEFEYLYTAGADLPITYIVFHTNYKDQRFAATLSTVDQAIPINQGTDRVYLNP